MLVAHALEGRHVASYLCFIFSIGLAELEVDDDELLAIGDDAVWPMLDNLLFYGVVFEDGTLVEHLPTSGEPVGHLGTMQALVDHVDKFLACEFVAIKNTLFLQTGDGGRNIVGGTNAREKIVQDVTQVEVHLLPFFLVVALDEVATLVALLEGCLHGEAFEIQLDGQGRLQEDVLGLFLFLLGFRGQAAVFEVYGIAGLLFLLCFLLPIVFAEA